MFLKSYVDCSDLKLIEHLNGNIDFQLFNDVILGVERVTIHKVVSHIRTYLSSKLDIKECQKVFAQHWKPYIRQSNIMLEDETCYETSMRHPTK